jgi:hypothetical protein
MEDPATKPSPRSAPPTGTARSRSARGQRPKSARAAGSYAAPTASASTRHSLGRFMPFAQEPARPAKPVVAANGGDDAPGGAQSSTRKREDRRAESARGGEQRQRSPFAAPRTDGCLRDDPAGLARAKLAAEAKKRHEAEALGLAQRHAALQRLAQSAKVRDARAVLCRPASALWLCPPCGS